MFDLLARLPLVGFRAARDYERLRALQAEAEALLENPYAAPFEAAPGVSGWTPAQHLHHLASINASVFGWLRAQCADTGAATKASADGGPNLTGAVLLLFGRFPRGRAQAPEQFEPPASVAPEALEELRSENRASLHALEGCLPRLCATDGRAMTDRRRRRHPVMGRLNPREWLRFARIHTGHHLRIVRDIVKVHG